MEKDKLELISPEEADKLQKEYQHYVETDKELSLEVDPTDKYHMSPEQKDFIKYYVDMKSIMGAADFAGISPDLAKQYFTAYSTQQEIRRINHAMYHRQFNNKLISLDEIGGYLSSLLQDEVPLADRIKSNEKLKVAQMIIDLNDIKLHALSGDTQSLMSKDLDVQLKELSVNAIKQLLEQNDKKVMKEKKQMVNYLPNSKDLSPEEKQYLETLSTNELLDILNQNEREEENAKQTSDKTNGN